MSGISSDKLQVLALLQGILTTYDPDFVLPLPDGVLSFTYRLVMELVRDCLTKYHQGRISSEYLEHLQKNIWTLVQQAEEKSQGGELAFFKQLAQNVLLVLEYPAYSLERLETSNGDSEERQNLNIADADTNQPGLKPDLMEGIAMAENTDGGKCETPEIIQESASALVGSLNPGVIPCKNNYEPIKLISSGAFGTVHLVRHKYTIQICAMKKIDIQNLKNPNRLELAFLERDISAFADCPFVASMFCSFTTKLHLCMVMEYVPGGDCDSLINYIGPLPVSLARMYIAETVLAVEYLHSYGVVHRDLKPENLLVTSTGHIKVTDLGVSKLGLMRPTSEIYKAPIEDIISEFSDNETVGTPKYMAPEVILKKGYGRPVDWWSVGIILYQFLFGFPPFNGSSEKKIVRRVLRGDITWTFNNYSPPPDAQDIITELLRKNPAHRLGTARSRKYRHVNSDEGDTREENVWPEIQNFISSTHRFSKLHTTNTRMLTNEEPMSLPECSPDNSDKYTDVQKKSSPSQTDDECSTDKISESSLSSLSDSPVRKGRKSALKLRKREKTEKVEEGESRRGSIFRRMISSCRRGLSRAARAVRRCCIFACCHQGTINI
ncbi:microtubule-associated serine/threonine-protein kinase 4-like isoform X2 [Ranitomeya variabilis]|uniref:microtubule-associated serine/threonine-protein kinase 4-like isoform X2 n=1 Tax=Ranitomeya variabilis TaxID=490064 RepID=UPI0040565324